MPEDLSVLDLHSGYGSSTVLHGVSFSLQAGRISVILGRNGVGKTTLIRALAGHNRVSRGRVLLSGIDVTNLAPEQLARRYVGVVPQGRRLFPSLSVREHLQIGARPTAPGMPGWDAARVIRVFPRLGERLSNLGGMLSGGEQSMVAIGRALVGNPRVLLLDEPSEGLSPRLVDEVERVLHTLRSDGLAILLVEQNLGLAIRVADQIHIMSKGQIVYTGTSDELSAHPETRTRLLGG